MQTAISLQDFGMQYRIDLYGIRFNQLTGCLIISLALDALNFGQQFTKQHTQLSIIVNTHVSFSVTVHHFHHMLCLSMFQCPASYQLTVAHMCLFYRTPGLYTYQLRHQAVHHVRIIFSLISLSIRHKSQFYHFSVGQIVKTEQIGTCFFNRRTMRFQSIRIYSRKQFS